MRNFLNAAFGENKNAWPPMVIVDIDDSIGNPLSIQKECEDLNLPFHGIHLRKKE
jgi:hypothetical protein